LRGAEDAQGARNFLRGQFQAILLLAVALVIASVLVAVLLARHFLRPVAALRDVTGRIARGELGARSPLLSRDELAELALHVNAMAEALEHNEAQRRRMVADVAHELRTPITVIRGEIEAVLDGVRQATPAAFESLHAEILRLNKLVDDLHQLALADAGSLSFDWAECDLRELLLPLLERYRPRAAAAGLALDWSLPAGPVPVRADSDRLTQVVLNLLENSVRYTDAGGRITVGLDASAGQARLVVDDSAPGVPDEAHARLFDRLFRVDSARSRERGGSGLGLSICRALVETHGGSVGAGPSPLGGVRITVLLPLTP
jgi:two-component system sensor histidine kinase BaeS